MVLVDESATDWGAGDWSAEFDQFRGFGVVWCSLVDALVRAAWTLQGPSGLVVMPAR